MATSRGDFHPKPDTPATKPPGVWMEDSATGSLKRISGRNIDTWWVFFFLCCISHLASTLRPPCVCHKFNEEMMEWFILDWFSIEGVKRIRNSAAAGAAAPSSMRATPSWRSGTSGKILFLPEITRTQFNRNDRINWGEVGLNNAPWIRFFFYGFLFFVDKIWWKPRHVPAY